jgi:hypothetical protein
MIAVYAFLAMFTIQILTSVLGPVWRIRYWRVQATTIPAERLAQLYPGVDLELRRERFFTLYRALHTGIAVLGLLLLGWLFSYMRRPDWDMGKVVILVCVYFLVQAFLPLGLLVWHGVRFGQRHKRSLLLDGKRKAMLQRRGLFDFVSPFTVFVAVVSYLLFAAFLIRHPLPGFGRLINLGASPSWPAAVGHRTRQSQMGSAPADERLLEREIYPRKRERLAPAGLKASTAGRATYPDGSRRRCGPPA